MKKLVKITTATKNYQPEYLDNIQRIDVFTILSQIDNEQLNHLMSDYDNIELIDLLTERDKVIVLEDGQVYVENRK